MQANFRKKQNVPSPILQFPGLIDPRNRDLWESLQLKYHFELERGPEPGYLTYFDNNRVVVEVDIEEISPAAFTHELLHVYLKSEGLEIVWDFRERVQRDPELQKIFSTSLRVHIGNCLEHNKMLPLFLSLGFAREDFLRDYHIKIMGVSQVKDLEKNYLRFDKVDLNSVDTFIGKYFAMAASVNPNFDYKPVLQRLQEIDHLLFSILNNFWESWQNFKLGEPKEKYLKLLDRFLLDIKIWINNDFR